MSLCREDADAVAYLASFRKSSEDVDRAKRVASRMMREAIDTLYLCPDDLASFPATPKGEELRDQVGGHALALAAYELSGKGKAAASKKVAVERNSAKGWISRARAGELDLSPLTKRSGSGGGGRVPRLMVVGEEEPRIDAEVYSAWRM